MNLKIRKLEIKNQISKWYDFYKTNHVKIIFILVLHLIVSYLVNLPYINIFAGLFSFIPYLFDWIVIMILFKPHRDFIFRIGVYLFIISFFFVLVNLKPVLEFLGGSIYLMIGTYILLSLKELREN